MIRRALTCLLVAIPLLIAAAPASAVTSTATGPNSDVTDTSTQLLVATETGITAVPLSGGTGKAVVSDGLIHPDVAVSPNGTMVAYTSTDGESDRTLWVSKADGSGTPTAIMTNPGYDAHSPTWHSNGTQLFYAINTNASMTFVVTSVAPGQVTDTRPAPFLNIPFDEPSYAGTAIIATDLRSDTAPLVALVGDVAKAIPGTAGGYTPVASPDTEQVAFLAPGSSDFAEVIKVVNRATGAVRTLPAPDGMLFSAPTWTRDMSALYVVGGDDNGTHLFRIGLGAGGTTTTVPGVVDPWAVAVSTPDLVGPVNVKLGGIPAVTLNSPVTPTFSASDALNKIATYEVHMLRTSYDRTQGHVARTFARPTPIAVTPGWSYCFWVVAIDRANNRSAGSAPQQCMTVPLDDKYLARSSAFTPVTNRAYYAGTAMKATARGQTLTRTGMTGIRQLTVIASACPTCGIVDVLFNGAKIHSINTVSATTVNRKVFTLPAFSVRNGTVTLKVASSGKQVFIDGLGFRK